MLLSTTCGLVWAELRATSAAHFHRANSVGLPLLLRGCLLAAFLGSVRWPFSRMPRLVEENLGSKRHLCSTERRQATSSGSISDARRPRRHGSAIAKSVSARHAKPHIRTGDMAQIRQILAELSHGLARFGRFEAKQDDVGSNSDHVRPKLTDAGQMLASVGQNLTKIDRCLPPIVVDIGQHLANILPSCSGTLGEQHGRTGWNWPNLDQVCADEATWATTSGQSLETIGARRSRPA